MPSGEHKATRYPYSVATPLHLKFIDRLFLGFGVSTVRNWPGFTLAEDPPGQTSLRALSTSGRTIRKHTKRHNDGGRTAGFFSRALSKGLAPESWLVSEGQSQAIWGPQVGPALLPLGPRTPAPDWQPCPNHSHVSSEL